MSHKTLYSVTECSNLSNFIVPVISNPGVGKKDPPSVARERMGKAPSGKRSSYFGYKAADKIKSARKGYTLLYYYIPKQNEKFTICYFFFYNFHFIRSAAWSRTTHRHSPKGRVITEEAVRISMFQSFSPHSDCIYLSVKALLAIALLWQKQQQLLCWGFE